MIIKSNRMAVGGSAKRLCAHLFRGDENDEVHVLQGGERDIIDAWKDAKARDASFAVRVWIISPHETMDRSQLFVLLGALATEFGFDKDRATVVEHVKPRTTTDASDRHWHIAVGEVDPVSGRVLSSRHDHARHEYLARVHEADFGHRFVLGGHTKSVLARLRREGASAVADALGAALDGMGHDPPREAFTTRQQRLAKNHGINLPAIRQAVGLAWEDCTSLDQLTAALAETGLDLAAGDVAGEWVVRSGETMLGSLRRLTRSKKAGFAARMKELCSVDDCEIGPGRRAEIRGADRRGPSADPRRPDRSDGRTGVVEGSLDHAVATDGERRITALGHDASAGTVGGRDRGDPSQAGGPQRSPDRPANDGSAARCDHGAVTKTATACASAVFQLVTQAEASARSAPERVEAFLIQCERAGKVVPVVPVDSTSRAHLNELRQREKALVADARTVSAEVDAVNARINDLLIDQRRRARLPWARWLPDRKLDDALAALRERRQELRAHSQVLAQARLHAAVREKEAHRAYLVGLAKASQDRDAAAKASAMREAILALVRTLLLRVPMLAYVGGRRLLAIATRIHAARESGYDPGSASGYGA